MFNRKKKVNQVTDLIVESFTTEELDKLAFSENYSFKDSLSDLLSDYKAKYSLKLTKKLIERIVAPYKRNPCPEEEGKLHEEIEVQLFKPTLLCKIRMWEERMWEEEQKRQYERSLNRSLNERFRA